MKPFSFDGHFFPRWLVVNAVGFLSAAMVGGAVIGIIMLPSAAGSNNPSSETPTLWAAGILFGVMFSLLLGAPALSMVLIGRLAFGAAVNPPLILSAALASAGAVIGLAQWTIIKDQVRHSWLWIVASACGWSLAGLALNAVVDVTFLPLSRQTIEALRSAPAASSNYGMLDYAIRYIVTGLTLGAIGGGASGVLQMFLLRGRYRSIWWWVAGSTFGWALGGAVAAVIVTGAGLALGGTTAGIITGLAIRRMFDPPATNPAAEPNISTSI